MANIDSNDSTPDKLGGIENIFLPENDNQAKGEEAASFRCLSMVMHYPEVENIVRVLEKLNKNSHEDQGDMK